MGVRVVADVMGGRRGANSFGKRGRGCACRSGLVFRVV